MSWSLIHVFDITVIYFVMLPDNYLGFNLFPSLYCISNMSQVYIFHLIVYHVSKITTGYLILEVEYYTCLC